MAGHSQFKNIMHRKGAQDAKRAKQFTKIIREIYVAAKEGGGPDPELNSRLRVALINARQENMPKENIDRAIKRAAGEDGDISYEALRYEGRGPGGISLIIEVLTDNKNRSACEIRTILQKHGGSLGESNSTTFLFDHLGYIAYPASLDQENFFFHAVEAGACDVLFEEEAFIVLGPFEKFSSMREMLSDEFGDPMSAQIIWKPKLSIEIKDEKHQQTLGNLIETLEDNDDVQFVWHDFRE